MPDTSIIDRLSATLKREIAPAIEDEYAKTQAYMASVVVAKLGRQLSLDAEHRHATTVDMQALLVDLKQSEEIVANVRLASALDAFEQSPGTATLCALIESLYAARADIGPQAFANLLGRVRQTLRSDLDRRMEYAR